MIQDAHLEQWMLASTHLHSPTERVPVRSIGDATRELLRHVHVQVGIGIYTGQVAECSVIWTGRIGYVGIHRTIPGIVGNYSPLYRCSKSAHTVDTWLHCAVSPACEHDSRRAWRLPCCSPTSYKVKSRALSADAPTFSSMQLSSMQSCLHDHSLSDSCTDCFVITEFGENDFLTSILL